MLYVMRIFLGGVDGLGSDSSYGALRGEWSFVVMGSECCWGGAILHMEL